MASNKDFTYVLNGDKVSGTIYSSGGSDGYKFDNFGKVNYNQEDLIGAIKYIAKHNITSFKEFKKSKVYERLSSGGQNHIEEDLELFMIDNGLDWDSFAEASTEEPSEQSQLEADKRKANKENVEQLGEDIPKEAAFNAYWNDMLSLEEGTLGKDMYNRLTNAQENVALANMQLADAQYANLAMQQAQTVKNITDQVKSERMARLRAGMSEAQIANQDMQLMMSNINALNQQAAEMNTARLQAQQQYNLAQDTAYQEYLNNIQGIGNIGAAMSASDAGDLYQQMLKNMYATGSTSKSAYNTVSGANSNK